MGMGGEEDGADAQTRIDAAAADWVARLDHDTSPATRQAFEIWLHGDARCEDAFLRVWGGHEDAGTARPAWRMRRKPRFPLHRHPGFLALAAALVLTAAGGLLIEKQSRHAHVDTEMATSESSPRSVQLADGSLVRLMPDSRIRARFDGQTRAILLERGSARFQVAHDADHPFIVSAGDSQVTARGTIFDVALGSDGMAVTMIEGVVDVTGTGPGPHAPVRLARGDRLVIRHGGEAVTRAPDHPRPEARADPAIPAAIATAQSLPGTPLATLIGMADRNGGRPIRLEGAIGDVRVLGHPDTGDTHALALQLAAALGLELREDARGYILAPLH